MTKFLDEHRHSFVEYLEEAVGVLAGDQVSFYTRSKGSFPDRLQLRLSTNGTSFNVGSTTTSTGDFSTLLLDINPTYKASNNGGFPATWTQYTLSLPTAGSGRLAFRYFVEVLELFAGSVLNLELVVLLFADQILFEIRQTQ